MPDPLLGLGGWPGIDCAYRFGGTESLPELTVTVSARPDAGLPGPEQAACSMTDHSEQYRLIGAQLDAGVTVSLSSTLEADLAVPVSDGALRRLARAAELFAGAATAATTPELAGLATLDELLNRYGLSAEQLAAVNVDRPLTGLLAAGQDLARRLGQAAADTVPADASTLAEVAGRLRISSGRLLADNRGLALAADPTAVLPGRVTLPSDARIPYCLRDGDTLASLAQRFATTARELVTANATVAGTLLPGIRIEVPVASGSETVLTGTDTLAGDSFAAVRGRLAGQRADVSPDAVTDALARLGPVLAAGPVLSCPLAVLGSGTSDRPVSAAEVQAEYGCSPQAFAAANAAVLGLLEPGVRLELDGAATTTTEHDTVHAVLGRLGADATIDRLLAGAGGLPLFRAGARALLPPSPVSLTASPGRALRLPAVATPLVVTLRLERSTPTAEAGAATVERVDTTVPPSRDLDALVDACLTAMPALRLATDPCDALWAVSFGNGGIAVVRVESATGGVTEPRAFALRPLYPTLIDLVVGNRPVTATGELGEPEVRVYHGVDVEPWARSFLADLDGYLAEPLRCRVPDAARDRLAECRGQLSEALADGLAPLLTGETGSDAALAHARITLASLAGTGLADACAASVLAQYRAVAVSPYGVDGRPAARLLATVQEAGRADLAFSSSRTELDPSSATCTFGLTPVDPGVAAGVASSPRQAFDGIEIDLAGQDRTVLRFVRPLAGGYAVEGLVSDLPPVELPVPLREQPAPVAAPPMTAEATFAAAAVTTLAEAMQWTAGLGYVHRHAAQDVIRVSISGQAPAVQGHATPGTALAEALACYLDAAAPLGQLIGTDVEPPDGTDAGTLRGNAVASLITLVTAVTTAWRGHRTGPASAGVRPVDAPRADVRSPRGQAGFTGEYLLRAVYSDGSNADGLPLLERLVVSRTAAAGDWPAIAVAGSDQPVHLTPGPVLDNSREYTATEPLPASPLTVRLEWHGLRGTPEPDARVGITAERNAGLPGSQVDPAFVLTAQPVQVAVPSPSLHWKEELALPGTDLDQVLRSAFEVFAAGQPERRATFQVAYAEPFGDVQIERPALLAEAELTVDGATQLAASMRNWQLRDQPPTAGAAWHLRVTVGSLRDGEPPLAVFERLVLRSWPLSRA